MHEKDLRILVVHSSAELYGSDRSLLDFVRHRGPHISVTVALPEQGILVKELEAAGAKVIVGEVCKIQRGMFTPRGFFRTVVAALHAIRFLGTARKNDPIDVVYSNTVAVLGGALCARLWRVPHVWHVREILSSSKTLTVGFRQLVSALSSAVVCNSGQTLEWIRPKAGASKYRVIWNGFDVPQIELNRDEERAKLGLSGDDVLFVLVGRINAWKGQKLLVDALALLASDVGVHARLAIVGSAPAGQEHFEKELTAHIEKMGVVDQVKMIPYRPDIEPIWVSADVVVVPSTEPEPFGRVAIEAMGFGRPVIAAGHGGLVEIVVDGQTGRLVTPRDATALASAMKELQHDAGLRQRMGEAGMARQRALFSVGGYAAQLAEVMQTARR
jgi:glycosyltransferase involved in cell wall biosynthesis